MPDREVPLPKPKFTNRKARELVMAQQIVMTGLGASHAGGCGMEHFVKEAFSTAETFYDRLEAYMEREELSEEDLEDAGLL